MFSNTAILTAALAMAAAAAPTPLVKRTSAKGGVVYNDPAVTQYFKGGPLSWSMNYDSDVGQGANLALNYHPMLHDLNSGNTDRWSTNAQNAIDVGATALLGLNEPDVNGISPSQAADSWRTYFGPFEGKGVTLVSPAVTSTQGTSGRGLDWTKSFLSACSGCQIDAIGVHWYGQPYDNDAGINNFKQFINDATALGKPVWVTEYGFDDVYSEGAEYPEADKESALKEMISFLESTDGVAKHSYFMASTDSSGKRGSLVSGNGLSALGKIYNSS